jgi:hypothetical protein
MKTNQLYNRLSLFILMATCLTLGSCEQTELMDYDGPESVYFYNYREFTVFGDGYSTIDFSREIEFMKISGDTVVVLLNVFTTGRTKDYDRRFGLEAVADSTTAVSGLDYDPLPEFYTIKAGETRTFIPIVMQRNASLRTEEKRLYVRLVATEDFSVQMTEYLWASKLRDVTSFDILVNDFVIQPELWIATYWGEFSVKKIQLMCEILNFTYDDFSNQNSQLISFQRDVAFTMSDYLTEKYNAGTPVREEDGRLMWFSYCPWGPETYE